MIKSELMNTSGKRKLQTDLQESFVSAVRKYLKEEDVNQKQLAKRLGMRESLLSELLGGKRPLSRYYIDYFHRKGVVVVGDLYNGEPVNDEQDAFWKELKKREELYMVVERLKKKGIDGLRVLKSLDNESQES
jgi:transcriptional regulator with XRE-family HTH domain